MCEFEPTSFYDSALLETICEGDPSAWCFLPAKRSEPALFSQPFRKMWDLPSLSVDSRMTCPQPFLSSAMETMGVPAEEFFARAAMHKVDVPDNIQLLKSDGTKILASVQCVFSNRNGAIIGQFLRFRTLTDTSAIDSLFAQITAARKRLERLSRRELEILNFVYQGRTNKSISITTGISEKTVEKHRARIMLKLGLNCTTMMVRVVTVARMLPFSLFDECENYPDDQPEALHHKSPAGFNRQPPTD